MRNPLYKALAAFLMSATAQHATAIPVFDAAVYAQTLQEVAAWRKQLEQMNQQLKQMQDQNAALTGSRGLGTILDDPRIRAVVPLDPAQMLDPARLASGGGLTAKALQIRQAAMIYDCEKRSGADLMTCRAFLTNGSQTQAMQQQAIVQLNQRMDQITGLQGQINATTDPKAIGELTARLISEAAQISNDGNRLMVLRAMADSTDRATQQAIKERELLRLSRTGDGSASFVYKPYTKQ